ncbi:MAG TPA: DUF1801 domain-containing protein [Acidobacteria bacterium]|nr:DUF1801 domain-containing protein [Acidobacteriota bacterium]
MADKAAKPAGKTVDGYVEGLDGWQKDVVGRLRRLVLEAVPQAKESIKWAQPVYEQGGPFAYIKAFKNHVNFGFWRGASLHDPQGLIQTGGEKMGHLKITGPGDIREKEFRAFILEAVRLNEERGDPTKNP